MMPRYMTITATLLLAGCFQGEEVPDAGQGTADVKAPGTLGAPCYGNKTCNSGLTCNKAGLCEKRGDSGPPDIKIKPEAATQEEGGLPDLGPDGGSEPRIVITEIMVHPKAVSDAYGEYVELFNMGTKTVNLHKWIIATTTSTSSEAHEINAPKLSIKPNQYLVLSATEHKAYDAGVSPNGGVPEDYSYYKKKITLNNPKDTLVLRDANAKLVDRVDYVATGKDKWPVTEGAAMSLKSVSLDNNKAANWCVEQNKWTGSAGDKGSPGSPPDCGR